MFGERESVFAECYTRYELIDKVSYWVGIFSSVGKLWCVDEAVWLIARFNRQMSFRMTILYMLALSTLWLVMEHFENCQLYQENSRIIKRSCLCMGAAILLWVQGSYFSFFINFLTNPYFSPIMCQEIGVNSANLASPSKYYPTGYLVTSV